MFLEDSISICEEDFIISVDDRGRITIPSFTKVEPGEYLCFRWAFDKSHLILESEEENKKVFTKFESILDELLEEGKIDYHKKIWIRRVFYGIYNFMPEVVSKDRKIKVPKQAINQYGLTKKVKVMVKDNHLEIYNIKDYKYVKEK